jgi:hypothetical protein
MAKSEVATKQTAEVVEGPVEFEYAGEMVSFDDVADEAITLPSRELAKDEVLDSLVGVEFIATRVIFREGLARRDDNVWKSKNPVGAYVSVELVTNPHLNLNAINMIRKQSGMSPLVSLDALGFDPGAHFVINDGSTGIYRQMVAFLAITDYIDLPEGAEDGPSGTTILDTIPAEWPEIYVGETKFDNSGFQTYTANIRLRCKHGIRVSEYPSEFNPDSKTRYLA